MTFIESLIKFVDELADAKECEFWECPLSGPEPHHAPPPQNSRARAPQPQSSPVGQAR